MAKEYNFIFSKISILDNFDATLFPYIAGDLMPPPFHFLDASLAFARVPRPVNGELHF
jgi:hypothetical protein